MTKLCVISDSHRNYRMIDRALKLTQDCALVIHLGDHDTDMDDFRLPESRLLSVPGNCDPMSFAPGLRIFERDGVGVLMTHGDAYGVKYSLVRIALKAKEAGAQLALFGHSHRQELEEYDGVTLLNPGALKQGQYAVVTLDGGNIRCELRELA